MLSSGISIFPVRFLNGVSLAFIASMVGVGCADIADEETMEDTEVVGTELNPAEPEQLYSLDELMTALYDGRNVTSILYYRDCTLDGQAVIDAVGGMDIEAFEYFGLGAIGNDQPYVAFSKSSLVLISGYHYYDYVKVRVFEDGYVQVIAEYLNPETYAVDMYEEFDCALDQGDGGSVTLHAD